MLDEKLLENLYPPKLGAKNSKGSIMQNGKPKVGRSKAEEPQSNKELTVKKGR